VKREGKPISEALMGQPPKFGGPELADVLRFLSKPDEEYLTLVENLIARQSKVTG
jgi:hypothetical protein